MSQRVRQVLSSRRFYGALLAGLFLASCAAFMVQQNAEARPTAPTAKERRIAQLVTLLAQKRHLTGHKIDDEIAKRAMKEFFKTLDPRKLYFLQSDVDEFLAVSDQVDDMVKKGDLSIANKVFDRLLTRMAQRMKQIDTILAMKHDFTLDESIVRDADDLAYPKTDAEAMDRWRRRIKFELLVLTSGKEAQPMDKAIEKLKRRYKNLAKRTEQTDNDDLLERFLTSLTMSLDPHSTYMSPSTLDNFFIAIGLKLEGIGASLTIEDGYTVIKKIIPGGAADKHGKLQVDDKIIGVGQGKDGEIVDVVDMKLDDVVEKIRGKAGTIVRLEVLKNKTDAREVYTITRAKVEMKDSEARGIIIEKGKKADGSPYKLGVIDLPSFYLDMQSNREEDPTGAPKEIKRTTTDMRRILKEFNEKNVDAVILDLRQNGGGSLTEAVQTTGLFIHGGPVVQVKGPDGRVIPYDDPDKKMVWEGPLVVLTSKFSASASEIFAGAIQDYGRGIVIGDKSTHGKGTVQQLFDIGRELFRYQSAPKLGALKLTIQQFYRPDGDSTQNLGVVSDIELPSITSHWEGISESDLDYALAFDKVKALPHTGYNLISSDMLTNLRAASKKRWSASEDFSKDLHKIELYVKRMKEKTRTINREKFLAERKEFDSDEEAKEQMDESLDDTIFDDKDYYNAEVLNITLDYLKLLQGKHALTQLGKLRLGS